MLRRFKSAATELCKGDRIELIYGANNHEHVITADPRKVRRLPDSPGGDSGPEVHYSLLLEVSPGVPCGPRERPRGTAPIDTLVFVQDGAQVTVLIGKD